MISRLVRFVTTDIWRFRVKTLPPQKGFFVKLARVVILAIRGYLEDNCMFRASALTFFTMLSIVPVIAVIFAIANGFGLKDQVEKQIRQAFSMRQESVQAVEEGVEGELADGDNPKVPAVISAPVVPGGDGQSGEQVNGAEEAQQEAVEYIIEFANKALSSENLHSGVVEGIAIAFFFWTIIKVLGNIEDSFNHIWGIKRGRHFGRKFSDYLSVLLVCPILLVMSSSFTVAATDHLEIFLRKLPFIDTFWPLVSWTLNLTKYVTIWIVFSFLIMFMPNTRVKWHSGVLAGIVSGTLFVIVQGLYIKFQIGVAKYGAIYGSFATVPLFLIWLQISWFIVLFGAELAFAYQNVDTYEFEPDCLKASYSLRRLGALTIMHKLVKDFCDGKPSEGAEDLARTLEMPVRLVRDLLYKMVEVGLVSEIRTEEKGRFVGYQPGLDVDKMSIKFVMDKLEQHGVDTMPIKHTDEMNDIQVCLQQIQQQIAQSQSNRLLKEI